jgi:hypothetical protein
VRVAGTERCAGEGELDLGFSEHGANLSGGGENVNRLVLADFDQQARLSGWHLVRVRGVIASLVFHAFGRFPLGLRIGTATADLPLCCDIQLCNFAFALLELPKPTRTAMAFNVNVVSRRNRAAIASF